VSEVKVLFKAKVEVWYWQEKTEEGKVLASVSLRQLFPAAAEEQKAQGTPLSEVFKQLVEDLDWLSQVVAWEAENKTAIITKTRNKTCIFIVKRELYYLINNVFIFDEPYNKDPNMTAVRTNTNEDSKLGSIKKKKL
jgi:hypothetical protein